ncbi:Rho guanine nucleotide exchange factor 17 [Amphibalanus amphitrite]|uniref:Rho guanine nucleotide exchange factor 17 n=1 Tax=Amphibalanus amphitrite TaxID=1232801 RepID=A0A6A4V716_AMPAM|nr:Rho guanine nucleotide exchange factor 17 [Amphibalanus amphitrite]
MRVENSVELASLATGAGRPSGRRKPAAGPAPTLCLHFAPPEINFSQGEVANAAAAPADAARNDGGEWWRGTVQRAPHLPAPARAVPCRRPWPQLAGAAAERPAEPGCRDRHAVTMPRPPAAPGAPAEGAAALLRRREAFSKGHSVSLDSADGLVTAAGADAAPPAGRAAAHESGSLSDTEEPAPDSSVFSRLRLRVRQSPPPPPPAAHSKKAPERPQSPKAKARRVDRLPLTIQPVYFSINKPAGTPHTTSQTLPKKFKAQNAPVPEEDASLAPIKPTHVRHKSDPVKDWEPPSTEQQSEPPAQASNPRDSLLLDALLKEINSDTCLLDRDDKQTAAAAVDETPATTKSGEDGTSSTPSAHAGSDSAQLSQPAEAIAQSPANETDTPAENTAGKSAKQTAECSTPPADGKQPLSNETKATDDAPQPAHEDVLNINLDQLDEDGAEAISQVQENFRQAVKMAVETLLSEVSAGDEQTELTSLPSGAEHEREVAHVRVEGKEVVDEWTGAEDLTTTVTSVRKEQRQTDQTLPPLLELEGKAASISQHDDTTERRQARPRRFKSKSLSPVPFRFAEEQLPQLVEEAAEPETLQRPAASRAKSRSLEHKQRSFDLLDRPPRERKRNQKRKEKVGFMLTTDQDSLSSSSSDEAHSRGRSQTLDPDFARPKAEKMRLKSHSARGRTTSDTATLRPLLTHQSHMGELLTLDEPLRFGKGRRHASPSFLSYDSDVDRFPRSPHGPRRRLRGPYGEMLEGKMSRGDTNRMARDDDSLKFLSSLVESASPSPTPANSSPRVSRQERSSGPPRTPSDGELVQLEPSHVRTVSSPSELAHFSELLSEGYYDGVSPAAEGLISQLTAQEVGQLRAQPRKRIPEILEIHEDFLRELLLRADNWSSQQGIGEVFLDKLTQPCVLDTYTAFVNNWPTAREALRRACQLKPGLAKYLESLERSNKRKLSFTHLLIMPVQRIPRYELLLKAYEVWASLSETEQRDAEIVRDKLHSAFAMGPDAAMSELYRRRLEPGMTGIDALRGVSVSGGSVRFGSEDPAATEQREAPPEREVCRAVGTAAGVQREAPPEREVCRAVGTAVGVQREAPPEREVCRAVGTAAGVQREAPPEREACRAVGTAAGVQREAPPEREACRAVDMGPELRINETDFTAVFDAGVWTVRWKWAGGVDPPPLRNSTAQYGIPRGAREKFDAELSLEVLAQNPRLAEAVRPYADDLLVNEAAVSADEVAQHFARFGLECKPPERVASGARMLGLRVAESDGPALQWTRDGGSPTQPPPVLTRRTVFAWAGQLTSHVPVAGWLRPAAAWMKRTANRLSPDWDTPIVNEELQRQVDEVSRRVIACDPACGQWCVTGSNVTVWTDASSIARGVVLADPVTDAIIEDASWLRAEAERDVHINISELDAALNGVNMALAWGFRRLTLRTDSVTVHRWLSDALSGKARLRTKGQSEMLIRRRVAVFRQLVAEYELEVTIELVGSAANRADEMTRVPNAWLQAADRPAADSPDKSPPAAVAAITSSASPGDIRAIHENIGHQGVRRTLWYARRELGVRRVTKTAVRDVVRRCQTCASIDPAPERWLGGSLETERTWDRLAMDVTHLHGHPYLTLVDCGPSRYAIWRRLRRSGALEIVQHLEDVFLERGAPAEILTDNATEFRGRAMMALAARWDVAMRFRAAYEPGGNGVVERHHRTIKVMVARQACSVAEAVHRYNVTPKDGSDPATAPINEVFRHPGRDVDVTPRGRTNGQQCDALPLKTPGVYQQLVAHTPADHPDLEPLRSALAEVHLLATRINSLEQETMQNEALLQMLREVEAAVDGLDGLVTPDRVLVRHDQVTMTSALGTKKDRCLFLFNDLLVIASSKRRTGTARKPSTALDGSVTGLEANKYKLLMKIPLADLNIARSKDENLSSLLKEVEKIEEDITTLRQIGIMVCKLHCNHYQVEELVKEMANVLNKQLAERHRADSQLVMTQLNVTTPDGIENISMNFPEIEKRTAWEQTFNETKQKLALSAERRPVPEFLYPLPIRKTRAGLQFTCAAATPSLSSRQCSDVWVCNSDGYVGQICVLSLRPEPTVTSCNGVCNSRILCIAPVPGSTLRINGSPEPTRCASTPPTGSEPPAAAQSGDEKSGTIDLDSSSDSSDSDESRADDWRDDSSATGGGGAAGSSWDMQSPEVIQVASTAVNRLAVVSGKLWACSQNRIRVINPTTSAIEQTVTVSSDSQATVQALVPSGLGVWLSFHNLGTVRLFHTITFEMICEVDVTSAVTRMLSGCDDIIRQHKTACLRVTSLMVCKDLLWIGTSAGVILNLPLPLLTTTTSWLTNTLSIADPALFARLTDHGKSIRFSFY